MAATPTTLDIFLPELHAKQRDIIAHPAKRKVVCAGRRGGKTTLAADVAIEKLLEGRRVLLSSPSQQQADTFWDKCKAWLSELILAGVVVKNEQRRTLTMADGRIKVKTASDADQLRGDYADFLVLDECAYLAPNAWQEVGAPMLLDNDGDAWFISTPARRNWFHTLYQRATADGERWAAWHFTSFDNPYLSRAALDEIAGDLTEEAYKQEILAEFLEGEGAVFRNITANLTAPKDAQPAQHTGHTLVAGVDWAQKQDYTVISVGCATCRSEVALDRFNKIEWAFQRGRLRTIYGLWKPRTVLAEENSIGSPNIEALRAEGMRAVQPFQTTATSKPPLIQSLALAFERMEWRWLDLPVATAELAAYEAIVSPQSGRMRYSAPEGMHDDTVIARALMHEAASGIHSRQLVGLR